MTKTIEEIQEENRLHMRKSLENEDIRIKYLRNYIMLKNINVHKLAETSGIDVLHILYDDVDFDSELEKISVKNLIELCNALEISADFIRGNFESDYLSQQLKNEKLSMLKSIKSEFYQKEKELDLRRVELLRQVEAIEEEKDALEQEKKFIRLQMGERVPNF